MKTKRIIKLIDILEKVPDHQYDDRNWVYRKYDGEISIKNALLRGFVGDAGGWACQSKKFNSKGLVIDPSGYPSYNGNSGETALAEFFGLNHYQAVRIFFNIRDKIDVINVLKEMLLNQNLEEIN